MKATESNATERLNAAIASAIKNFAPSEDLNVSEWADKYRRLSRETSAEPGPWRTARTPYLEEPMKAFCDPKITDIVMVAASQVGKTEFLLNCIGYLIDQDPASAMLIQPTREDMQKFSRVRIAPMIRDSKPLREKVADVKTRDSGNTILQKVFPGGVLTLAGSNSPSALASTPIRYIFGDERDRWAKSAGTEGDPWELTKARQTTFYNRKSVEVSTPTVKGRSNIETAFYRGTQERWSYQCPHCGEWHDIRFDDIRFTPETQEINRRKVYSAHDIGWACPSCGAISSETEMRRQPKKWIAANPSAYDKGVRSFWLNAFSSPWTSWETIIVRFLEAKDDPERLQVVFNTLLGELWEDRGDIESEDEYLSRREEYPAELPNGVLALTCGVDTQDNRLEYEVVGHGHYDEKWGIEKGVIMGRPDTAEVWERLDDVIDHVYKFADGKGLKIGRTFVDSGGHYTQEVYEACRVRQGKWVFAIKGKGGSDIPFISLPTQVAIRDNKRIKCWLYTIGVDAGKTKIMNSLRVQEPGARYSHFPRGDRGYDETYFSGLLSEKMTLIKSGKRAGQFAWEKIPGHQRNEPLDCRNYANAAFVAWHPDLDAIEQRMKGAPQKSNRAPLPPRPQKRNPLLDGDDW